MSFMICIRQWQQININLHIYLAVALHVPTEALQTEMGEHPPRREPQTVVVQSMFVQRMVLGCGLQPPALRSERKNKWFHFTAIKNCTVWLPRKESQGTEINPEMLFKTTRKCLETVERTYLQGTSQEKCQLALVVSALQQTPPPELHVHEADL